MQTYDYTCSITDNLFFDILEENFVKNNQWLFEENSIENVENCLIVTNKNDIQIKITFKKH